MQSWLTTRSEFQSEYDTISNDYTGKSDPTALQTLKDRSTLLFNKINSKLSTELADQPTADLLSRTGTLQQQIQRLHKIKKDIKVDVESAVARDEVLRSRDTKLNSHKLFLLNRPIRKGVIPYLWVLSVLFIGISLIIFRMMLPESSSSTISGAFGQSMSISLMISEFFENKMVLISIIVALLMVVLFLGLKMAGMFG
jgi:preprotein translocase subunit SecG